MLKKSWYLVILVVLACLLTTTSEDDRQEKLQKLFADLYTDEYDEDYTEPTTATSTTTLPPTTTTLTLNRKDLKILRVALFDLFNNKKFINTSSSLLESSALNSSTSKIDPAALWTTVMFIDKLEKRQNDVQEAKEDLKEKLRLIKKLSKVSLADKVAIKENSELLQSFQDLTTENDHTTVWVTVGDIIADILHKIEAEKVTRVVEKRYESTDYVVETSKVNIKLASQNDSSERGTKSVENITPSTHKSKPVKYIAISNESLKLSTHKSTLQTDIQKSKIILKLITQENDKNTTMATFNNTDENTELRIQRKINIEPENNGDDSALHASDIYNSDNYDDKEYEKDQNKMIHFADHMKDAFGDNYPILNTDTNTEKATRSKFYKTAYSKRRKLLPIKAKKIKPTRLLIHETNLFSDTDSLEDTSSGNKHAYPNTQFYKDQMEGTIDTTPIEPTTFETSTHRRLKIKPKGRATIEKAEQETLEFETQDSDTNSNRRMIEESGTEDAAQVKNLDDYQEDANYSYYKDLLLKKKKELFIKRTGFPNRRKTDDANVEQTKEEDYVTAKNAVDLMFNALQTELNNTESDTTVVTQQASDDIEPEQKVIPLKDGRRAGDVADDLSVKGIQDGRATTISEDLRRQMVINNLDDYLGIAPPTRKTRPIAKETSRLKMHYKFKMPKIIKFRIDKIKATKARRRKTRGKAAARRTTTTPILSIDQLLHIIHNLSDEYVEDIIDIMNKSLADLGIPTCPDIYGTTPHTTTTTFNPLFHQFQNLTGTIMGKCFVCGIENRFIPHDTSCADAFNTEFLPLVPVEPKSRRFVGSFRKYCRWKNIPRYWINQSDTRNIWGRWTGGCVVRFIDVSTQYTERVCRNRHRAIMGKNFASKRLAKLEMSLQHVDNGCIISPMSSLIPLSRGISVYARFTACVCSHSWCNGAVVGASWSPYAVFIVFAILLRHLKEKR